MSKSTEVMKMSLSEFEGNVLVRLRTDIQDRVTRKIQGLTGGQVLLLTGHPEIELTMMAAITLGYEEVKPLIMNPKTAAIYVKGEKK